MQMAELRFDEVQAAAVLQRAVELQASNSQALPTSVSLTDLQRMAGEVGIDPTAVERAAHQIHADAQAPTVTLEGESCLIEQTVQCQLSSENWEDVVTPFRALTGRHGDAEVDGARFEWRCRSDQVGISLVATQLTDRVRVRLVCDTSNQVAVGWTFGATCIVLLSPLTFAMLLHIGALVAVIGGAAVGVSVAAFTAARIKRRTAITRAKVVALMKQATAALTKGYSD